MPSWYWKGMTLGESVSFQEHFEMMFARAGGPKDAALFSGHVEGGYQEVTLLLPPGDPAVFVASSRDGWESIDPEQVTNWVLLVGNASAPDDFGVELGAKHAS